MTRKEAIEAMEQGIKVTHRFFTEDEFVTMNNEGKIVDENGYTCRANDWWAYRNHKNFETDWEIYKEKS